MVATMAAWSRLLAAVFSAFAALAFSFAAHAQSFPSERVRVRDVSYAGTGCPHGSVRAILAPDASSLTVLYDRLESRAGGATGVTSAEASCRVEVRLDIPLLWSVNIDSIDVRGFVSLERGMTAYQDVKAQTGIGKNPFNLSFGLQLWRGPVQRDFVVSSVKPLEGPNWLSCIPVKDETKIDLRTRIRVDGGGAGREGLIAVDSADGRLIQRYKLSWRNCLSDLGSGLGGIRIGGREGVFLGL